MKPIGESFGFGTLITVFLPGLALALGIVFLFHGHPDWLQPLQTTVIDLFTAMKEWQQTFAALAIISLLGSLVASINGLLETCFYDRITTSWMDIRKDEFDRHWYEYLYQLGKQTNVYVSRIVTWFLFESRMAVALLFVLIMYWCAAPTISQALTFWLFLSVVIFSVLAAVHHYELAMHRSHWCPHWSKLREAEIKKAEGPATLPLPVGVVPPAGKGTAAEETNTADETGLDEFNGV